MLTTPEVARALGLSRQCVWTRCIRGDIRGRFIGGKIFVDRHELARLLEEREQAEAASGSTDALAFPKKRAAGRSWSVTEVQ
jgi:hypothetical protein